MLTSVVLFTKKKHEIAERKQEELAAIKRNAEELREVSATISALLFKTSSLREALTSKFKEVMGLYKSDYLRLGHDERLTLGALVNDTLALARLLNERVEVTQESEE